MKRLIQTAAIAAATIAVCATAASGASALSLGPAGTKVSGQGNLGQESATSLRGIYFPGGPEVLCNPQGSVVTATLDGSASLIAPHSFRVCRVKGGTTSSSVTVTGGLKVTLLSYRPPSATDKFGRGTLSIDVAPGGLSVKVGNCTLTLPDYLPLASTSQPANFATSYTLNDPPIPFLTTNYRTSPTTGPYGFFGSDGCATNLRYYHPSGAGIGLYNMAFYGAKVTG